VSEAGPSGAPYRRPAGGATAHAGQQRPRSSCSPGSPTGNFLFAAFRSLISSVETNADPDQGFFYLYADPVRIQGAKPMRIVVRLSSHKKLSFSMKICKWLREFGVTSKKK
jgi:hypothetical protein